MLGPASDLPSTAHPKIVAPYDYWLKAAPTTGVLPGRQHIDPIDIPSLLENIWLVDVYYMTGGVAL